MDIITIRQLLGIHGLDTTRRIKLVRHKDNRETIVINGKEVIGTPQDWYRNNHDIFLDYQSEQSRDVFKDVDYIVSFIGEDSSTARFLGVFKVLGYDSERMKNTNSFCYHMEEVPGFESLSERVIIDWGVAAISWHQWLNKNDKEVIGIVSGFEHQFPGYNNVSLSLAAMKEIILVKKYPEWLQMLSAVNCIYVIADSKSESVYIGSTYGRNGILGRWTEYAKTGHGNDVTLQELINADPNYATRYFTWSILEVLPINISSTEAVSRETRYKQMLGKACKLNNN